MRHYKLLGVCLSLATASTCGSQHLEASAWSDAPGSVAIRAWLPDVIEASSEEQYFYVKCEVRNAGPSARAVTAHARIYLVDESGAEHKCLRSSDARIDQPLLAPGETATWWQHGLAPAEGHFRLTVRWDGDEAVSSPEMPVRIEFLRHTENEVQELRQQVLQEHAATFVEVAPNTAIERVHFQRVAFTNDPLMIDGLPYSCFRFRVPEPGGYLVWAFSLGPDKHFNGGWYIQAASGSMQGFRMFDTRTLKADVGGIGASGDTVFIQDLGHQHLDAGREYILWFYNKQREIDAVQVSLNVAPREADPDGMIPLSLVTDWTAAIEALLSP